VKACTKRFCGNVGGYTLSANEDVHPGVAMYRYAARLGPELGLPHGQLLAGALITARGPPFWSASGSLAFTG
jgi:hypothetical protein